MWDINRITRLDFELTSFCNISCSGCSRSTTNNREDFLNKKENILSLELIKSKFKKEMFPSINCINFCGSIDEPTSHPDFLEIVRYFREWDPDMNINIATNGSIRTVKFWTELAEILKGSRHCVTWGIDGSDELSEVYRAGSNYKKVQQNYRAFNAAGGTSMWQFIIMEHNKHQVEEVKQVAKDEGFWQVKYINSARKEGDVEYVRPEVEEEKEVQCRYLHEGFIFINCLGDVIPCCYWNFIHLELSSPNYKRKGKEKVQAYADLYLQHGGTLASNLRYNEVKDVIEGDWFDAIADSWLQTPLMEKCETMCKTKKTLSVFNKEVVAK